MEVLTGADFDGIKAMHRLFQVFRQYSGEMITYKDEDGNERIAVGFGTLSLMSSWYENMKSIRRLSRSVRR